MAKKITDKVLRDLIMEVLDDEDLTVAIEMIDDGSSVEDITSDPDELEQIRQALEGRKSVSPENSFKKIMEPSKTTTVRKTNSVYETTSPIFNFDLFTGSNLSDVSPESIQNQTANISSVLKNAHKRLINQSKGGGGPLEALRFLSKFFEDPFASLSLVDDLDGDDSVVDDQISTFFVVYIFYSFLENLIKMNSTSMGFQMENWLALVLGGESLTAGAGGNLYDLSTSSGEKYSLKFYLDSGTISQASTNIDQQESYNYLIAVKDKPNPSKITFYEGKIDGSDLLRGVVVKKFINDKAPLAILDVSGFAKKIKDIKEESLGSARNKIPSHILNFGENIEQLKIFLSYWFLESTESPESESLNTAANGIKISSEKCIGSLKAIASNVLNLTTKPQTKEEYDSEMKKILESNEGLIRTMELPNIRVDQLHGQTYNGAITKDFILEKISNILGSNSNGSLLDKFQNSIIKTSEIIDRYMVSVRDDDLSLADCFAALIILDSLKYLYDLKVSNLGSADIGGGPGSATAGFIFENFISIFGQAPGLSSYAIGGNDQKIDFCVIQPIKNGRFEILGFSSKSGGKEVSHISGENRAGSFIEKDEDFDKQNNIWKQYPSMLKTIKQFLNSNNHFILKHKEISPFNMSPKQIHEVLVAAMSSRQYRPDFYKSFKNFMSSLRAIDDSGNSNIVWISCVKAHVDEGKSTNEMKTSVYEVIKKAQQIAKEVDYNPELLGTLFGGKPRNLRVYDRLAETEEYKNYQRILKKTYDLRTGMFGNPANKDQQTISISMGPSSDYYGDEESFQTAFEIASFPMSKYLETLDVLKEKINETKNNFLKAFEEYNEFKVSSASFLENPTQNSWTVSHTSYENFKKLANEIFISSGLTSLIIKENVITLDLLQKLISESFKK
jgi:hypothetical protein